MQTIDVDVVVVGSGFAGSLAAMALARQGRRVALLERGRHPRFAIGESSTPLADLLLEELADRYDLPAVRVFSKWGTWRRSRPDVAAGLKRGFSFFFHRGAGEPFLDDDARSRQMLVAASPHDEIADTHWYRPDFDAELVRQAQESGVVYLDECAIEDLDLQGARVAVGGVRQRRTFRVTGGFLVDASGPRGFLQRALALPERPLTWLPATQAVYTHFEQVDRWANQQPFADPPFPPDDAALHHVFPGGWIWVLRFNNGLTSAGAALTDPLAREVGSGAAGWLSLLRRIPSVRDQFADARESLPFVHMPRIGYRTTSMRGGRWALLPSAAGVIDPLLSTGFPLTLLGIARLLEILDKAAGGYEVSSDLARYEATTQIELDATERLVGALYAVMDDPEVFKRMTLLYFAAASFGETVRRLGLRELARGFLLSADPRFAPELDACADLAAARPRATARQQLFDRIDRAIEPFDVAGLGDHSRLSWYPVRAADLIAAAGRLGASRARVERLLERSGFAPSAAAPADGGASAAP